MGARGRGLIWWLGSGGRIGQGSEGLALKEAWAEGRYKVWSWRQRVGPESWRGWWKGRWRSSCGIAQEAARGEAVSDFGGSLAGAEVWLHVPLALGDTWVLLGEATFCDFGEEKEREKFTM